MQLFVLAPPLILVAWLLSSKKRHVFLAVVSTIFMLIPGIMTWYYDYGPTDVMQDDKNPDAPSQHDIIYKKPWCRAMPYLIGIWLAFWIHDRKGIPLLLLKINHLKIFLHFRKEAEPASHCCFNWLVGCLGGWTVH